MEEFNKFSLSIKTTKNKSIIKGAISPIQEFVITNKEIKDNFTHYESNCDTINAFLPMNSDIVADFKNKIFVNANGAVCDAYDLSAFTDKEREKITKTILVTKKYRYPGYDFVIKEGIFPLNINGSCSRDDEIEEGITPNMSTHILYLKNYQDFLPKSKIKQKR